jgi:hypothetical protein
VISVLAWVAAGCGQQGSHGAPQRRGPQESVALAPSCGWGPRSFARHAGPPRPKSHGGGPAGQALATRALCRRRAGGSVCSDMPPRAGRSPGGPLRGGGGCVIPGVSGVGPAWHRLRHASAMHPACCQRLRLDLVLGSPLGALGGGSEPSPHIRGPGALMKGACFRGCCHTCTLALCLRRDVCGAPAPIAAR